MKFLIDSTLGKLAKWLRILGYDAAYHRLRIEDREFENAAAEGRIFLSRQITAPGRQYGGQVLVISHDRLPDQLSEVREKLSLAPEAQNFFTRCLICNAKLLPVGREDVAGEVPAFIIDNYTDFRKCTSCKKVFWPGTHRGRMLKFIETRNRGCPL